MTDFKSGAFSSFATSQSAFVRGFIDDAYSWANQKGQGKGLNPRSCAASSMTKLSFPSRTGSVRVSIRVRARLHR